MSTPAERRDECETNSAPGLDQDSEGREVEVVQSLEIVDDQEQPAPSRSVQETVTDRRHLIILRAEVHDTEFASNVSHRSPRSRQERGCLDVRDREARRTPELSHCARDFRPSDAVRTLHDEGAASAGTR